MNSGWLFMNINWASVGVALILIGFLILIISAFAQKDMKIAVGGFIGPIPFGWANDPQLLRLILIVSAVIAIAFMVLLLR
jgi:uncharacterized membrane protein